MEFAKRVVFRGVSPFNIAFLHLQNAILSCAWLESPPTRTLMPSSFARMPLTDS